MDENVAVAPTVCAATLVTARFGVHESVAGGPAGGAGVELPPPPPEQAARSDATTSEILGSDTNFVNQHGCDGQHAHELVSDP